MNQTENRQKVLGYLPNDIPPVGQMILLGFQHVLTMFPATVLVALLVGFHVSTVLLASGLATIVALLGSRWGIGKFIPLYYGSSFSYIAATLAITGASFGQPVSDDLIRVAQAGFVVTGLVNILFGLLIRFSGGKRAIDAILPPIVTGSVAAVIGVALGKAALDMASGTAGGIAGGSLNWWAAAMVTLLATILFSVYLQGKGFIGMLPILLGAIVGYLVAIPLGLANLQPVAQAKLIVLPHITLPSFSGELAATAVIGIAVMAIATIPESTTHLYFDPGQLAIGATILIVGIGGHIGYPDGFLPIPLLQGIFPRGWPAIATAAVAGILLNLIFSLFKPATVRPHVEADVELKPGAAD